MSNTPAESVPVATSNAAVTETVKQPKKFDNVQKTVAYKAKAFLNVFHSTGENIRGNINAALDGAGDAIAGRKSSEVTGRKSGDHPSRRSVETGAASSASAASPAVAAEPPVVAEASVATPAEAATEAKVVAAAEPAVPVAASTPGEAAPTTNAAADTAGEGNEAKRIPVGQFINLRLKRTIDLVTRVGSSLRTKSTRTVESLGSTITQGKQRASRRFSRAPKAAPAEVPEAAEASATPVPAEVPLPETPAVTPAPLQTSA